MNAMAPAPCPAVSEARRRKCLLAGRAYEAGEPVLMLHHVTWWPTGRVGAVRHPSGRYFSDPLLDGVIHRDDPNCRLSFELMVLIARRAIAAGEVISSDLDRFLGGSAA